MAVSLVSAVAPRPRQRGRQVDRVVGAEPAGPHCGKRVADRRAAVQLHRVPLAVGEADRLHMRVAVERPGEAGRAVLPAGEQHQRAVITHRLLPLPLREGGGRDVVTSPHIAKCTAVPETRITLS